MVAVPPSSVRYLGTIRNSTVSCVVIAVVIDVPLENSENTSCNSTYFIGGLG